MEGEIHNCDDEELGAMLHRLLIVEGNEEVVIYHPTDGEEVVTREGYLKTLEHLNRAKNMSPAERFTENKHLKNKKQIQFRTAMIEAKVYTVDVNNDEVFGVDIDGIKINIIDGMKFIPICQYLPGIDVIEKEIGAFVDESMRNAPIRILAIAPMEEE